MPKRNRITLKNFFRKGALPSEEHFADLVDSSLNMIDEGFSKSPANGIEITTHGDHSTLMSFFRGNDPERPTWSIAHARDLDSLLFMPRSEEEATPPSVTMAPEGKIGINTSDPQFELDVKGTVRSEGRIGTNPTGSQFVPADGNWHSITEELNGCQAFEVMAGVGKKKTGRYALMHATVINTFNPKGFFFNFLYLKRRIRYTQAYYNSLADKLRLRWYGDKNGYFLQLRSNTNYGEGIRIRYHLTKLWFEEDMNSCWNIDEDEH